MSKGDTSFGLEITKGEWKSFLFYEAPKGNRIEYSSIGPIVGSCYGFSFVIEKQDDAKAISAVPELLEVATMARDYLNSYKLGNDGIRNAQADLNLAIKKLKEKLDVSD